jgi:serine/threonine-protein kinase
MGTTVGATERLEYIRRALAPRYAVHGELGRGRMSTVYLAHDHRLERPVAVKVLLPELAATVAGERFSREILISAQLQHPHILTLLDSGVKHGMFYFVLPFVEGESLEERLARIEPLSIEDAVRIAREVADGLHYAHRHGVIHRDVKPSNILLSEQHAMITDFGVARALGTASVSPATPIGQIIGTPSYLSPEQATGESADARADVYSLGCVLYEMLTGEPPYTGSTPQEVLSGHLTRPVPSVREARPEVTPGHDRVIRRALAKHPVERFETAQVFRQALKAPEKEPTFRLPRWPSLRSRLRGRGR